MFPRSLQYLLIDFPQTITIGAPWDTDQLIMGMDQKVEGEGHIIVAEAYSTPCCHQVHLSSLLSLQVRN